MTSGCFQKQSALKGRRFQDSEATQKHVTTATGESYSITVPEMLPTVAALLRHVHRCSNVTPLKCQQMAEEVTLSITTVHAQGRTGEFKSEDIYRS
jgi:hypothetical protein